MTSALLMLLSIWWICLSRLSPQFCCCCVRAVVVLDLDLISLRLGCKLAVKTLQQDSLTSPIPAIDPSVDFNLRSYTGMFDVLQSFAYLTRFLIFTDQDF